MFCGTCSVESKLSLFKPLVCNDIHPYLIAMLKGVQNGYDLPTDITEERWKYIREHLDEDPVLSGFVGFGCSFGGKWWGGYARNNEKRNYAAEAKRSLLKDMATLGDATFTCMDYRDVPLPDGCVVYADPPYANTTKYCGRVFDHDAFWDYMRTVSKSHVVFISEESAPKDFVAIWEKQVRRTLNVEVTQRQNATEKLFVHRDYVS